MPIYCNGFKDDEYLELVLLAKRMGRPVVPIIERLDELHAGGQHDPAPVDHDPANRVVISAVRRGADKTLTLVLVQIALRLPLGRAAGAIAGPSLRSIAVMRARGISDHW